MRLTLIHNRAAGNGEYVREELLVGLESAGHDLHACFDTLESSTLDRIVSDPGDAILIAGGDGTVRSVARRLVGRDVRLAVLPMGTANNIAHALGLPSDPVQVLRQLDSMIPSKYDVGHVMGPWGTTLFLEGAGFGPFVRTALLLSHPTQQESFDHSHARLARDRQMLQEMILSYSAQACVVVLDRETVTADCLAVHIMNLPSVGPNLMLAPDAEPGDGYLDVVVLRESDRQKFADFVAAQRIGETVRAPFPVYRTRHVRLHWEGAEIHIDDEFHQAAEPTELCAKVAPGELTFLRPARSIIQARRGPARI